MPANAPRRARRSTAGLIAALLAAGAPAAALAQSTPTPTATATTTANADASATSPAPAFSTRMVRNGLFLIEGGGGNSLVRLTANGVIVVDGKSDGNYAAFRSAIRRIARFTDLPVRVLVVTDHHDDHAGNYRAFMADHAGVVAQARFATHVPQASGADETEPSALKTFDDEYDLHWGGIDVQVRHFGSAQTDDATVVYFPNLKVVAVGDLFTREAPSPDYAGGGSLVSWSAVLAQVLALDFDVAVPGAGAPVGRSDLEAFKARIDTLVARGAALREQGVPPDLLMARLDTSDLGWRLRFTGTQLDAFYAELARPR